MGDSFVAGNDLCLVTNSRILTSAFHLHYTLRFKGAGSKSKNGSGGEAGNLNEDGIEKVCSFKRGQAIRGVYERWESGKANCL